MRTVKEIRSDIRLTHAEESNLAEEIRNAEWIKDWSRVDAAQEKLSACGIKLNNLTKELKAHPDWIRQNNAKNLQRREKHACLTSLGLKRVRGALGGIYYE